MTSVRRALAWSFAERYASVAISLVSSMIVARLLTPAEVGVFSMCAAVMVVATMVREFGVNEYIVQEREMTVEKLRSAYAVAFCMSWSLGALLLLARQPIAAYYGEPRIAQLIAVLSLNFFILPLASPAYGMMNRAVELRRVFVLQTASTLANAATAVLLAWRGFGAASLAWASVAAIAVQTLLVIAMRPAEALMRPDFRHARPIFRYGAYQMSARLTETLTMNAHEFIIARRFGFTSVGLFSRAKGLVDLLHANLISAIARVSTPVMAQIHRQDTSLLATYARGTAILAAIAWPLYGLLAIAAPEVIYIMLGSQWQAAAPIAVVLAIGMTPAALYALGPGLLAATGKVELKLRVTTIVAVVHLAGLALAMPFGLLAMAAVWLGSSLASLLTYAIVLRRQLACSMADLYRPSLASLAIAVASIGAQFAAMQAARAAGLPAVLSIAATLAAGAAAWGAAARAFSHPAYAELSRLVRRGNPAPSA